jgi:hypothetical protein
MRQNTGVLRIALAMILCGGIAACGDRSDEFQPVEDTAPTATMPGMEGMPGAGPGAMGMDPAMMERYSQGMDSTAAEMRRHVQEMRAAPPEQWHARMQERAPQATEMLGMMDRHMRGTAMGMGMTQEQMAARMGMSAEERSQMLDEIQALREEAERFRTAPEAEVRQQMPAHLDRMERMIQRMEQAAAQMRTQ